LTTYLKGETALLTAEVRDPATNNLTDPDTVTISVYDAKNGPEVSAENMTKDSVGQYHYDVDTSDFDTMGMCTVIVEAVNGTRVSIERGTFQLDL
jgi:hypothetical protein